MTTINGKDGYISFGISDMINDGMNGVTGIPAKLSCPVDVDKLNEVAGNKAMES